MSAANTNITTLQTSRTTDEASILSLQTSRTADEASINTLKAEVSTL